MATATKSDSPTVLGAAPAAADAPAPANNPSTALAGASPEGATPDTKPASSTEPVDYALELPEKSPISADHVKLLVDIARTHAIAPDAAQLLLTNQHELALQLADHNRTSWAEQVETWGKAINEDKDLGGERLKTTVSHARAALAAYWAPEFMTMLDESGLGNHPDFIRGLAKLGRSMSEPGAPINGGPSKGKPGSTIFTNSPEMFSDTQE